MILGDDLKFSFSFKKNIFPFLMALVIPLFFIVCWHLKNSMLPNDDAGDYLRTAVQNYNIFQQDGFWEGLKGIFLVRGWRPIFFPVFVLPFLFLTQGHLLSSVAITLIFLQTIFIIYAYFLLRKWLSPWNTVIGVFFISSVGWIFITPLYFLSEAALITCTIAACYHLLHSRLFSSVIHTLFFGFWLGLGLMVRPVKTGFTFIWIGLLTLGLSFYKKQIRFADLVAVIVPILGFLFLFYCRWFDYLKRDWLIVGMILIGVFHLFLIIFGPKLFSLSRSFQWGIAICHLMALIWWLPFIKGLYSWVHVTTGELGALYHQEGQMDFLKALTQFFNRLGGYPLLILVGIFCVGAALSKDRKVLFKKAFVLSGLTFLLIVMPIFMLSLTSDIAFRRAAGGFVLVFLAALVLSLDHHIILKRVRSLLVFFFAAAQFFVISLYVFDLAPPLRGKLLAVFGASAFPLQGGDASLKTFHQLNDLKLPSSFVSVFSLSQRQFPLRPFDTSALLVVKEKYRSNLDFGYPSIFYSLEEGYAQLFQMSDYILLDVTTELPEKLKMSPYEELTADLIQKWKDNALDQIGLEFVDEFFIQPPYVRTDRYEPRKIVLLKNNTSIHANLKNDNVALNSEGAIPGSNVGIERNFLIGHLNDGSLKTPVGTQGTTEDTYFYIVLDRFVAIQEIKLCLFSTERGGHIRDVVVVATQDPSITETTRWTQVKSRLSESDSFKYKITIPNLENGEVVTLELDPKEASKTYRTWGIACLSQSEGYLRNYIDDGTGAGIYLNEMMVFEKKDQEKEDGGDLDNK